MTTATQRHGANKLTDSELLSRVAGGDRSALHALYVEYFGRLGRFLSRVTSRPEVIEEVINDTMFAVWNQAGQFRGDSRPSTWIFGIAYRLALKAVRRDGAGPRTDSLTGVGEQELAGEVDVDDLLDRSELDDWLETALSRLSAEHRLAIELTYFMGMSCEEVSQVADCPVGTVKTRVFYARRYLKSILRRIASPAGEQNPAESPL